MYTCIETLSLKKTFEATKCVYISVQLLLRVNLTRFIYHDETKLNCVNAKQMVILVSRTTIYVGSVKCVK